MDGGDGISRRRYLHWHTSKLLGIDLILVITLVGGFSVKVSLLYVVMMIM